MSSRMRVAGVVALAALTGCVAPSPKVVYESRIVVCPIEAPASLPSMILAGPVNSVEELARAAAWLRGQLDVARAKVHQWEQSYRVCRESVRSE